MRPNRFSLMLLLLASAAVIATVLLSQYVGGLQPCELCLYERWPYYATMALTVVALLAGKPRFDGAVLTLAGLIFLAGTVLGAYHVGVEQHWIAGPTACTGSTSHTASIAALQQALEARQPVSCDVVQWSFHGLSLAALNAIASLLLTIFSFWAARRRKRAFA